MRQFDAYLFVDWSASNRPCPPAQAHTIWLAAYDEPTEELVDAHPATRREAYRVVLDRLCHYARRRLRVLVGFDFAYGYPSGLARALYGDRDQAAWRRTWMELATRLVDDAENRNNRFAVASALNRRIGASRPGPFWGCPQDAATSFLHTTRPAFPYPIHDHHPLDRLRVCEHRLTGVQEPWKLAYPGSVGSQALTGIPYLHRLRTHPDLADISRVWPFETGFTASPSTTRPAIIHAEIWPGIVKQRVRSLMEDEPDLIRDQAQVRAMGGWAREMDRAGRLGHLFDMPTGLAPEQCSQCVEEEGWILGAA
jgi:precorrin-8X/cobalt-precorrin-8 methylmutase